MVTIERYVGNRLRAQLLVGVALTEVGPWTLYQRRLHITDFCNQS